MFIKYVPRDEKSARTQSTNLGSFNPYQVGGPYRTDQHRRAAKMLVDNGEFIETDSKGEPITGAVVTVAASESATPQKKSSKKPAKA